MRSSDPKRGLGPNSRSTSFLRVSHVAAATAISLLAGTSAAAPDRNGQHRNEWLVRQELDLNPIGPNRRLWSFDRLSRDDEPGRKRIDFHCWEKIGRRRAGNNELSVVFSLSPQLARPADA
jgi:hypothetical protein